MIFNDLKLFLVVPATGIESFQSPGKLAERMYIVSVKNEASFLNQFYAYENSNFNFFIKLIPSVYFLNSAQNIQLR